MTTKTKIQEKHKMSEIDDNILKHFEIKKRLGKGAYGIVWKALERKTNQILAVKKIFDAFRDETDAQRTFREIMFLRAFRNHPNIIQLHNIYRASNNLDIYLSFEFMESDLHNVIKKGNILKDIHKRFIFYQLLNAISYIHSGNVIHRDLKPSNVLIDTKCRCKLADFGLARSVSDQRDRNDSNESIVPMLTDYVATRWYRAPEILVASKRYTKGIDMWSLGCILGEMVRGRPIFQGSSTIDQIDKIVSAMPEITEKDILAVGAGFGTALLNKSISTNSSITLNDLLIDGTNDAVDLVKRLLVLDPMARLTASEALKHKYVEKFRHSLEETELTVDVRPPFRDDIRLSVTEYRSKLYEIVHHTEKSLTGKTSSINRKRDPTLNNKINDSSSSKFGIPQGKYNKRNESKSQDRNAYIPKTINNEMPLSKVPNYTYQNKVHIITPPAQYNKTNSKTQSTANLNTEPLHVDSKFQVTISKNKNIVKSALTKPENSKSSNSASSPEVTSMQRLSHSSNKHILDKRHSIDGSCNYDVSSSGLSIYSNQPTGRSKHTNVMHKSYSSINKETEKSRLLTSRQRKNSQHLYGTKIESPENDNNLKYVSSKTEEYSDYGSDYYEKRLRRLEEEIEKHKREVKAFCSESTKNPKAFTVNRSFDPELRKSYKEKNVYTKSENSKHNQFHSKFTPNSLKNTKTNHYDLNARSYIQLEKPTKFGEKELMKNHLAINR